MMTMASASAIASLTSSKYCTVSGSSCFASLKPLGSCAFIMAPLSNNGGIIDSDGESRISSVSGLKVKPRIAMFFPETSPNTVRIFFTILAFCAALTSTTLSTMRDGTSFSCAIRINAKVSLGKHDPP